MDLQVDYPYDAPLDVVWAMFVDPEFIVGKVRAAGALECDLVECATTADGGHRIVTTRTVQAEIPSFARKVFNPTQTLTQFEDWEAESGGVRPGEWRIEPKGVPVKSGGATRWESTADGCVQRIEGVIKVSVPLIGGKLEKFVYDQARATLDSEHEFGRQWLADRA